MSPIDIAHAMGSAVGLARPPAAAPVPVDACAYCDVSAPGHRVRYAAIPGFHTYVEPPTPLKDDRRRAVDHARLSRGGAA
ncbi:hypothetical protein [Streptomonospora litoralis]|uniref:hypothetical protein n=1 Tax=Streptomonospora litoralis TaxID=2498135 RepID=UPI00103598D1|nr:hypothetical protein [Streptomonospora litoralis]